MDIGCGIGGPAFHIAGTYDCSVHGIDFSHNMMEIAKERLKKQPDLKDLKVSLQECDFLDADLELSSYDVIHCRDTMVHVKDKTSWLQKFNTLLKPKGRLLITDYCRGKETNSEDYNDYVNQRGYTVVTTSSYCDLIDKAGFVEISCESRAEQYGKILEVEIQKLQEGREEFVKTFSEEEYEQMLNSWKAKLNKKKAGDHIWAVITAKKL